MYWNQFEMLWHGLASKLGLHPVKGFHFWQAMRYLLLSDQISNQEVVIEMK
jgi:hypothetical protein